MALRSEGAERIVVVGSAKLARRMVWELESHGVGDVVGVVGPVAGGWEPSESDIVYFGPESKLAWVAQKHQVDRLVFVEWQLSAAEQAQRLTLARGLGVEASLAIAHYDADLTGGIEAPTARPAGGWGDRVKRVLDVLIAAGLLLTLAPLAALLALLVRMTSPGPALYRCRRVGRDGLNFDCLKFRTMRLRGCGPRSEEDPGGVTFKMRNDPRVTRLGRFLRAFSLDEVPQLVNVMRGEMSLVGPRPLRPADLETAGRGKCFRNWVKQRSRVRPGLTGLGQVSGRSDLSLDELVELDLQYLRERGLKLDLWILAKTLPAAISRSGAY